VFAQASRPRGELFWSRGALAELHPHTLQMSPIPTMALEDFEKDLAASKKDDRHHRYKDGQKERFGHKHHHRHHRSSKQCESRHGDEDVHGHKRRRRSYNGDKDENKRRHKHGNQHHHREIQDERGGPDQEKITPSPTNELKRDSWMEAPSALDIDYVQRRRASPSPPKASSLGADFELKLHDKELNHHLRDLHNRTSEGDALEEPAQHEVSYTFGDAGSQWRMTKLKQVYRQAEETGRTVEEVALDRFGDLREFDDAREEEVELERRETYGTDYVGKEKPSGELFQERKMAAGIRRSPEPVNAENGNRSPDQGTVILTETPVPTTKPLDQTALNKLKAQLLKAQLRKDPQAAKLEEEYNEAVAAASNHNPDVVILGAMENRMLSSAPRNEAKPVLNRRGRERGQLEENDDMSIDDMVREERRTRGQTGGEGQRFAERIAKDAKFDNDLEYMDENASKLAKRVQKSELNLRNTTINEFQKMNRILDTCPLCHHEDTNTPPIAPVVSLATRTYLTLPTEPEITKPGACIIPIQHRTNLLECDEDEWEEIRNFMKSLTRLYHDMGRDVIFYENAAHSQQRKRHASMEVVPLPRSAGETAPAFFREAFVGSESEWSQHKKIIDTLKRSKEAGLGKLAFRRSLVKEMPYFHVWFELDGGMGHVVEDVARWPKGDLFAREVIGGMVDADPEVVRRQGRWTRGEDGRVEGFRRKWRRFDWTRALVQEI
jgi:Protein similar to CwfJ C-terminus 1/Protein similar to CwfJ C-terminus 2